MNPQRAGLLADLASTPWHLMRVLADEADDAGEPWLAEGWRYLARNRMWPWWVATKAGSEVIKWGWSVRSGPPCVQLPEWAGNLVSTDAGRAKRFDTLEECLLAGATAVGLWLQAQAAEEERKRQKDEATKAIAGCKLCNGRGEIVYSTGMREPCNGCKVLREQYGEMWTYFSPVESASGSEERTCEPLAIPSEDQ